MNSGILKIFGILIKVVLSDRSVYKDFYPSSHSNDVANSIFDLKERILYRILKNHLKRVIFVTSL